MTRPNDQYVDYSFADPGSGAFAVTPGASALQSLTRAIYVGTGGNITVVHQDGSQVTYQNVPSGMLLPVRAAYVLSSGTTASNIIGII